MVYTFVRHSDGEDIDADHINELQIAIEDVSGRAGGAGGTITVQDTASVNLTLTGSTLKADAIFGTTVGTVADGGAVAAKADAATLTAHTTNTANPHGVTKSQVGLGNVDNTSDAAKPVSTATQTALNAKANTAHSHASADVTDLAETIRDTIGAALVAGTNVTITPNDGADTITIAASGAGGGGTTPYADWDVYIRNDAGTYRAYDRSSGVLSANASLVTLFDAVKGVAKHVHFAAGSYTATGSLDLVDQMTVSGEGYATLITRTTSGGVFRIVGVAGTPLTGCTVRDLRLSGPSTGAAQVAGSGVLVDQAETAAVERCWIGGFGSLGDDAAIEVDNATRVRVIGNHCYASKNGICTGSPTSTTIRVTDSLFADNECYQNFDDGFHSQRGARNIVRNNTCWGHPNGGASDGAGLDFLGEEYSVMIGNIAYGNARGIEVGNTANLTYGDIGNVIIGNTCTGNSSYGMSIIASAKRNRITGNTIENNAVGIRFGSATTGAEIEDNVLAANHIHNNGTYGIDVFGYNTRTTIQDNTLSGHTTADIGVRTSTGTPAGYALIGNRTRSTTGIGDLVLASDRTVVLFGASGGATTTTIGVTFTIDGAGSVVPAGASADLSLPFGGTITGWRLLSPLESGTATLTVSRATYAAYPTFTEISGAEDPGLTAAQKAEDTSLTSWTTAVSAGDVLRASVVSASTTTRLVLIVFVTRTL